MNKFLIVLALCFFSSTIFGQEVLSGFIYFTNGEKLAFDSVEGIKSHPSSEDPYHQFIYIDYEGDDFFELGLNKITEITLDEIRPVEASHFQYGCLIKTKTVPEIKTIADLSFIKVLVYNELDDENQTHNISFLKKYQDGTYNLNIKKIVFN